MGSGCGRLLLGAPMMIEAPSPAEVKSRKLVHAREGFTNDSASAPGNVRASVNSQLRTSKLCRLSSA